MIFMIDNWKSATILQMDQTLPFSFISLTYLNSSSIIKGGISVENIWFIKPPILESHMNVCAIQSCYTLKPYYFIYYIFINLSERSVF